MCESYDYAEEIGRLAELILTEDGPPPYSDRRLNEKDTMDLSEVMGALGVDGVVLLHDGRAVLIHAAAQWEGAAAAPRSIGLGFERLSATRVQVWSVETAAATQEAAGDA